MGQVIAIEESPRHISESIEQVVAAMRRHPAGAGRSARVAEAARKAAVEAQARRNSGNGTQR